MNIWATEDLGIKFMKSQRVYLSRAYLISSTPVFKTCTKALSKRPMHHIAHLSSKSQAIYKLDQNYQHILFFVMNIEEYI